MTKKQKNKTIEDKDETIIEMAPIIKEKYTKLVVESVSDEIDKKLENITFIPRTIYKSKK